MTVPDWDRSHDPATEYGTTPQEIADYYTADEDASTAAFALIRRAVDNHLGTGRSRKNPVKAALFLNAAIATGFDLTGYGAYEDLNAIYIEDE